MSAGAPANIDRWRAALRAVDPHDPEAIADLIDRSAGVVQVGALGPYIPSFLLPGAPLKDRRAGVAAHVMATVRALLEQRRGRVVR